MRFRVREQQPGGSHAERSPTLTDSQPVFSLSIYWVCVADLCLHRKKIGIHSILWNVVLLAAGPAKCLRTASSDRHCKWKRWLFFFFFCLFFSSVAAVVLLC